YYSHIIVHADSPFGKLDDILKCDKSLSFSIGDPNSTSGFLVPTSYICADRELDPKNFFEALRDASPEAHVLAVAHERVDASTNNSENLQRFEHTAPDGRKQIKIIWTSPIIPLDPLVWRKDLDAGLKAKLYTFLLSYGRSGSEAEIKAARQVL